MSRGSWILNRLKSSLLLFIIVACSSPKQPLPVFGQKQINNKGEEIDYTVSDFKFLNQHNEIVTLDKYKNQVYVADFFFTTCATICPKMTKQLVRVQKKLQGKKFHIISHTVNPEFDTTDILLNYAIKMDAELSNWDFVTGDAQKIYRQAVSYKLTAIKDTTQLIPFVHSEYLVLVDKKKRIRGLYDGTNTEEVNQLIEDIEWLIQQ
ncbi:MAG: SCO family protein [Flavobacteriales bacterium]|mgnify:CR=1 FL=1|nr:SCO family protein [Flavobacteriales bacterium]|tara:strand:- start:7200 stop:7820 length:621 start_codon:yes stop_codon:yes gene_type:complete